jgi:DNA repair exonuclease SbcCD ATPase subunit
MDTPKEVNTEHSDFNLCPEENDTHYLKTMYIQLKNELNEIEKKRQQDMEKIAMLEVRLKVLEKNEKQIEEYVQRIIELENKVSTLEDDLDTYDVLRYR